ncbi:hypothetical protein L842_1472 [Mycobacterium intracellulare MIN_052511_1280]|nr:hypothetical protein L842_1472 [Mycobacterium intracellulare MIN_052511_1280]
MPQSPHGSVPRWMLTTDHTRFTHENQADLKVTERARRCTRDAVPPAR